MKNAVVLLSGGLDSTTCLAVAKAQGYTCYALSFDYGQRHKAELLAARRIACDFAVAAHRVVRLDLEQFGGSALTDKQLVVPSEVCGDEIPITYVPARNTIFLSIALGYAEVLEAADIFIGVSAVDYSNYPDCRPEFIEAFQTLAKLATKVGVEGQAVTIRTPLMTLSKAQTIALGIKHGVDYRQTVSCYQADAEGRACGACPSCDLRRQGFFDAGVLDPTHYF
jgi:7-cyano-7-deazaguanine synthase